MKELLVGIAGSGKTQCCLARAQAALAAGRPVLYLVPNADEAALVRRRLLEAAAGSAAFLPGILGFRLLARRLLDQTLPGWSERDPLARRLALRALLERWRGRFGLEGFERSARTAGFLAALDELLTELAQAELPPTALAVLAAGAATPEDRRRLEILAGLAADFAAEAASAGKDALCLDPPALLARAAAAVATAPALGWPPAADPAGGRLLVLDGFSHLNALERRLLDALVAGSEETLLALCLDPADLAGPPQPPFEALHALARHYLDQGGWTLRALGATQRAATPLLRCFASALFRAEGGAPASGEGLGLLQGGTPADEAAGVLREVRRALAGGLAPERIAVLYRQEGTGELLAERFGAEGIPFALERRRALVRFAAVDQALVLLDWASGEAPADLPQRLRGGVATPEALLAELQALGEARGAPEALPWAPLLAALRAREAAADWSWLDWEAALPAGPLDGNTWMASAIAPLLRLLAQALAAQFEAALGEADRAPEIPSLAADARALERLQALAGALAEALPAPRSLSGWTELLRREAEAETLGIPCGREGGGVLLGNPYALRLPELDRVFVCGLNEGLFPPAFREDPLLRDAERRALSPELPERRQRLARERYLFYVACTRPTQQLCLSWAERDAAGRPLAESQFLAELRRLTPVWPTPQRLPALALAEALRDPSDLRALLQARLLAAARQEAEDLAARAEAWLRAQGEGERLDAARLQRKEPPLAGHAALAPLLAGGLRLSASRLEAFADCPFRFLGLHLLGLEAAAGFEPGALEEGRLLHRVLELVYAGSAPPASAGLAALHERALAELAEELPGLASPRFRAGDARRLRLIEGFLARDAARLAATGFAPQADALEARFALPLAELPGGPAPGDEGVLLTGIVDRVDRDAEGRELVLDYKRGETRIEPPDAEAPGLFQLALYAWARSREASLAGAAYCSLREAKPLRGYFQPDFETALTPFTVASEQGRHWLDAAAWSAWLARVAQRLRAIVGEIRGGLLAPRPREGLATCERCELRLLCRWEEDAEVDGD
ncbi:hypothetical protein FJ251_05085 [bacterium]|nr:hypothetical protein [bacterium]